jgi:hypothetical protein
VNGADVVVKLHELRPRTAFPGGRVFAIMAPFFPVDRPAQDGNDPRTAIMA